MIHESRKTLNLKLSAFNDVTPDVWARANSGDSTAVEIIKNTVYEVIDGVLSAYNAKTQLDSSDIGEFKNFAWARITSEMPGVHKDTPVLAPIITKFNPEREKGAASFSTFIWKAVENLYKQFWNVKQRDKRKLEKENIREVSLDAPLEDGTHSLSDMIEDPQSLSRFENQEELEDEFIMKLIREVGVAGLVGKGKDPRYMKYFWAYLKASGDRELSRDIAFEEFGLQTYKDEIYNMVHNVVRPLLAKHFPEYAKLISKTKEVTPQPVQEEVPPQVETPSSELSPEEDAEFEERWQRGGQEKEAPIRRIDPKTMQYISSRLNLRKTSANEIPLQVWRDYQSTDPLLKRKAENQIYIVLLNLIRSAVNKYNPQWMSADDREDFIQKELMHFRTYSLDQYDPAVSKFDTFVFGNVKNHLNNAFAQYSRDQKNVSRTPSTVSLNQPIGEDSGELLDTVADPLGKDVLGELAASGMLQEINAKLQAMNPAYPKILAAWMDTGGDRNEASSLLAVQGIKLSPYTVYRTMVRIKDVVAQLYPESTIPYGARDEFAPPAEINPSTITQAPVYKIVTDPETGEESKIKISKVIGISSSRLRWASALLLWLKISKIQHESTPTT